MELRAATGARPLHVGIVGSSQRRSQSRHCTFRRQAARGTSTGCLPGGAPERKRVVAFHYFGERATDAHTVNVWTGPASTETSQPGVLDVGIVAVSEECG